MSPISFSNAPKLWILSGLVGAALLIGCAAKTVSTPTAPPPPAIELASISPVYFQSGSTALANQDDYFAVARAVENLQKDSNVYLLLVGYADPEGDPAANAALSLERAQTIRGLIVEQAGVSGDRILVVALGEESNASDMQAARRVEFIFQLVPAGSGAPNSQSILSAAAAEAQALADSYDDPDPYDEPRVYEDLDADTGESSSSSSDTDTGDSSSSSDTDTGEEEKPKREKKEKKSKEKEQLDILPTGIAEFDTFFSQVTPLVNTLRSAAGRIDEANTNLNQVMGLAADADPAGALEELVASAKGSIKLSMNGTKPSLSVDPSAPGQVQEGVQAVNGLVTAMAGAVADLAQVPTQAQALVAQAKALPSQVPTAVKSAGLSMGEMGSVAKAVKQNVKVTIGIPTEAAAVLKSSKDTLQMVSSSFK